MNASAITGLNQRATVNVTYLPEFDDAQKVDFTINGATTSFYVLVRTDVTTKAQEVIVLNYTTYQLLHVYGASIVQNTTTLTYSVDLVNQTSTAETTAFVQTFVDTQTTFIFSSR